MGWLVHLGAESGSVVKILAIDPGNLESAYVTYDTDTGLPVCWEKLPNDDMLASLDLAIHEQLAIEMIASYGMPVGREVFDTCVWIGRFMERWLADRAGRGHRGFPRFVYRKDVTLHLCGSARAKDANVRQALIDRFGPGKEKAVGRKRSPGPLLGFSGDGWAALGVAVTFADTMAGTYLKRAA